MCGGVTRGSWRGSLGSGAIRHEFVFVTVLVDVGFD